MLLFRSILVTLRLSFWDHWKYRHLFEFSNSREAFWKFLGKHGAKPHTSIYLYEKKVHPQSHQGSIMKEWNFRCFLTLQFAKLSKVLISLVEMEGHISFVRSYNVLYFRCLDLAISLLKPTSSSCFMSLLILIQGLTLVLYTYNFEWAVLGGGINENCSKTICIKP